MPPSITILLPAFNEEQSIGDTVSSIKQIYPDYEILVIDDGSTDKTAEVAMSAGANVWPHPYNIGNGASIKTGLRCAQGDWVVMMDADGQHDPHDIGRLVDQKNTFDMVIGARKNKFKSAIHRNVANLVYNKFASYVTKFKIEDLTSGLRLVRKDVAIKYLYLLPNRFSYPTTLTMAYLRSGRSITYIPIKIRKRTGKSKIKVVRDGARFLLTIIKVATLYSPFRIFFPISLFFFITGNLYYCYTYYNYNRFTNMSALLLSTSVIVFMMGLISEQISQMRYDKVE